MDVNGISIARALEIENASVISGRVSTVTGHLILETKDETEIDAGLVVPVTPFISPEIYGAAGDGVTDDTAAINAAAAAGSVLFGAKTYKINGTVTFPADKSQLGVGSGITKFLLGNAGKILLGSLTDVPTPREAGKTGMFTIEGNNTTPIGLHTACVGRGRVLEDIMVVNCVTNVLVAGSQNMLILGMDVANGSYGLVLDNGAGGNNFIGLQTLNQSVHGLDIRNSGNPAFPAGTFYPTTIGCTDNHFTNSRFEIPTAAASSEIKIQAGFRNQFHNCLISGQNLGATKAAVELNSAGSVGGTGVLYTLFENCNIQGDGVVGAGIQAINTGGYTIVKNCMITNIVKCFKAGDLDLFWCDGNFPQNQDVGTYFAAASGASSTVLTVFRGPDPTPWVSFLHADWTLSADPAAVRRHGPRAEYRGVAKAKASGGVSATVGTIANAVAPSDSRVATFPNRGQFGNNEVESVQVAGTNIITNVNTNNRELFFDGISYDVDQ